MIQDFYYMFIMGSLWIFVFKNVFCNIIIVRKCGNNIKSYKKRRDKYIQVYFYNEKVKLLK